MIPLTLYMRNFICYREQTLDFRGIHLACLTGNNGHGKSAILDALTWVLWGRSRVGARRDDELIHTGQTEMEVEFAFELAHAPTDGPVASSGGGVRYRVIRKRSMDAQGKRGQSSLDLQGWDPAEERYRSLSEPTISRTQAQIDDLLRMDYDTFINSAFLLQGRADEFTIKRPAERKRVLADILGLGAYDRYEKRAKDAAQATKSRANQLLAAIEQIDRELAREPEYRADVQAAEAELARLQSQRAEVEEAFAQARRALQEAESAQQQFAELKRRIERLQGDAQRLSQETQQHQERLAELETALSQADEIERQFAAYQEAAAQDKALNAKLARLVELNEEHSRLESQIAAARHGLDKERYAAAEQVQQLSQIADALSQEQEWQAVQAELAALDGRALERERLQAEHQERVAAIAALSAENKRAEADAAQIKEKIDLLSANGKSRQGTGERPGGARCPLCDQPLAEDDCARLLGEFEAELEAERQDYRQRNGQIKEHQQRTAAIQGAMGEIDRELLSLSGLQRKEAALAHTVGEARKAADALPTAQASLEAIELRLSREEYAPQERDALRQVELKLSELGYDAQAHRQVQADLEAGRSAEVKMQTLREARANVETVRLAIAQLRRSGEEIESNLAAEQAQAEQLAAVVQELPDRQRQTLQARQALELAHDQEQQASFKLGAARNKLEYCADLREQRVKRHTEEQHLREEQGIYEELQRAFGKNGVQAMLIEIAIPDIEQEANRLLARMTRGAMHVMFDTQRDTKTAGTIETLDIHITDALGTRSYETYSGGERYRINFAVRIALSKLLTRRAGAQLQMLVIDEGFGTQDNEGRDGLIDAINAIKDDFACILAITHIEELKDAFNVRIEVAKTPHGSEITIA
jgi:exonuclease SbcC